MAESLIPDALPGADPPANDAVELLRSELTALKNAFEQFSCHGKPELERLQSELQSAELQRDRSNDELQQLKRRQAVAELSAEYAFGDEDYLDFVLRKNQIDPSDLPSAAEFMQQFRCTNPHNFNIPVKPGSGSRPAASAQSADVGPLSRMETLENMLSGAPEIY